MPGADYRRFRGMLEVFFRLIREAGKVGRFLTHGSPHADEFGAVEVLQRFGWKILPGVRQARIEVWENGAVLPEGKTWEEHAREGTVLIGLGGGPFDEHPQPDGQPGFPGECAATLAARAIRAPAEGTAGEFIAHIWRTDTRRASPWGIGEIIKSLHRNHPDNFSLVVRLVRMAFRAWFRFSNCRGSEKSFFLRVVARWISAKKWENELLGYEGGQIDEEWAKWKDRLNDSPATKKAGDLKVARYLELEPLLIYAREFGRGSRKEMMEIGALSDAIACNEGAEGAEAASHWWTRRVLDARLADQQRFVKAIIELNEKINSGECLVGCVRTGTEGEKIRVAAVVSDNKRMNAVVRGRYGIGAAVVVIRQSDDHTQVFTSQKSGVMLDSVVPAVRAKELEKRTNSDADLSSADLGRPGMGPCGRWFYHRVQENRGSMLLNGSTQAAKGVPPTALSLQEVFEAVVSALTP